MTDPQDSRRSPAKVGPDGIVRAEAQQQQLNALLASVFKGDAGKLALAYLRSITLNAVCGPEISDAALRHREGMRHLVAIIEARIEDHHREQQRQPEPDASPRRSTRLRGIGRASP